MHASLVSKNDIQRSKVKQILLAAILQSAITGALHRTAARTPAAIRWRRMFARITKQECARAAI